MSQYLSSFFIDPVVRQARRFSRPSFSEREADQDESARTTATATDRGRPYLAFPTPSFSLPSIPILGSKEAIPSASAPTFPSENASASGNSGPLRLVEIENLEPAIPARQYTVCHADDGYSDLMGIDLSNGQAELPRLEQYISEATAAPMVEEVDEILQNTNLGLENGLRHGQSRSSTTGLPEDDGMGKVRRKILAIQRADSSNDVKARQVFDVMVEKHNASRQALHSRARSPGSVVSSGRPYTPSSPKSTNTVEPSISPPTSSSSVGGFSNPFQLVPEDLKPTYWKKPADDRGEGNAERRPSESQKESKPLGCAHYKRNIKLQCSACSRWYTCRFCHDEVQDHMLNRRETKRMLCLLCGCAQPAGEDCVLCGRSAAWYYCNVCKLWDDDPRKEIYHCDDCGICRIGAGIGKSHLHCKTCNVCMEISHFNRHRCLERSTECDCPICGEYLFTSPNGVVFMPCGHSIHRNCYSELMRATYRCPICSKSITNMEREFLDLKREIELQPMPEEFRDTKAWIYCNDCLAKTKVKYHWLGLECAVCSSFNTAQLSLLASRSRPPSPDLHRNHPIASPAPSPAHHPAFQRRHSLPYPQPRAAISLPSLNLFSRSLAFPHPGGGTLRRARSHRQNSDIAISTDAGESVGSAESEAESDVEFWGGESRRLFSQSLSDRAVNEMARERERESVSEEDDDDDDDVAEEMEDDDEEGDEGPGLLDQLEITGHR